MLGDALRDAHHLRAHAHRSHPLTSLTPHPLHCCSHSCCWQTSALRLANLKIMSVRALTLSGSHQVQASIHALQDGLGCEWGRHIDDGCICSSFCHCFLQFGKVETRLVRQYDVTYASVQRANIAGQLAASTKVMNATGPLTCV